VCTSDAGHVFNCQLYTVNCTLNNGGFNLKIREKLLDLKRRLSDRHMYSIVITVIGIVAAWGLYP